MRVDVRRFGIVLTGCVSGPVVALAMAAAATAEPPNPAPAPAPLPRRLRHPRPEGRKSDQTGTRSTGIRSTRAGTCLCHGVPAYSSRHCDEVSSLGATPGMTARPSPSV